MATYYAGWESSKDAELGITSGAPAAEPISVGDGPMHALRDPNDPNAICGEPILFRGGEGSEWNRQHIDACPHCLQQSEARSAEKHADRVNA